MYRDAHERVLATACRRAMDAGLFLVPGDWLGMLNPHQPCCCPMGALLLCAGRYDPSDSNAARVTKAALLLDVPRSAVNAFMHGFDLDDRMIDERERDWFSLGVAFRERFVIRSASSDDDAT